MGEAGKGIPGPGGREEGWGRQGQGAAVTEELGRQENPAGR